MIGIEDVVLVNTIKNKAFSPYVHQIEASFFENDASRFLFEIAKRHIEQHDSLPTANVLSVGITQSNLTENKLPAIGEKFKLIGATAYDNDLDWLQKNAEKWCQIRSAILAMNKSRDIIHGVSDGKESKDSVLKILGDALSFSFDNHIGHSFFDSIDDQYQWYHDPKTKYPSDLDTLNILTNGGVEKRTLNLFLAGINVGKTTWLINMAASGMLRGFNVLYISAEQDEPVIRSRLDIRLLKLKKESIEGLSYDDYKQRVQAIKNDMVGNIYIRSFPTGKLTPNQIKQLIKQYKTRYNITIDMLVVDYVQILKSSVLSDNQKSNSNLYYGSVAEELRAVTQELDICCWSAAQLNREGQDESIDITVKHIAGSLAIMATADFVMVGSKNSELDAQQLIKCTVLKNRYIRKNSIRETMLGLDDELQSFYDISSMVQSIKSTQTNDLPKGGNESVRLPDLNKTTTGQWSSSVKSVHTNDDDDDFINSLVKAIDEESFNRQS